MSAEFAGSGRPRRGAGAMGLCVGEDAWEPAAPPAQLFCETETALRKSLLNTSLTKDRWTPVRFYLTQCCCSVAKSCAILCDLMDCSMPGYSLPEATIFQSFFRFTSIRVVVLSNHFILCHPLLLLPSIFPSIRVCSNESALRIRWPEYWSFSFSISPSNDYSGLISFRIEWFDLLAVQGTLKSLFQHHSSKALILVW